MNHQTMPQPDRALETRSPLLSPAIREVAFTPKTGLGSVALIELYVLIDRACPTDFGTVVQFVCVGDGDGADRIALDMAWVAAGRLGKRILLLDGTSDRQAVLVPPADEFGGSLTDAAMGFAAADEAIVRITGTEMYVATLRGGLGRVDALGAVRELATMLDQLRHRFDMIVIVPPPSAGDALAVSMARYVDGSIVVVAAERTRAAAATRLKEVLIRSGSPLIGAVFYRPRNILPRFLRRLR